MSPTEPAASGAGNAEPSPAAEVSFPDRLQRCIEQRRADGQSLALLLVDCGVITRIDALWGYRVGNMVRARMIANLQAEVLRPDDFVGELGRDELACTLSVVEGRQLALLAAQKMRRTLNARLWLGDAEIYASPSVGIALFPGTADDAESLLRQARSACVAACVAPSRVATFEAGDDSSAAQLVEEGRLRSAIAEDTLDLVFQPQFDLRFGQIMGVEAMLRWRKGEGDLVRMRDAIAVAEAGGLVTKLISALLNRALRNCSEFRQRAGLDLRIAINLPARGLLEPGLPELVQRALQTWSLRPGRMVIEIEDLPTLQEHEQAQAAILRLNEIGVKLSLDDVRAPLSSLFWLATMPFQEIKIDLAMARDWAGQARSEGVLRSLIALIHGLKLDVIAIGAADEAQAAHLLELGCDFMQANFRGPPIDAEEFVTRFGAGDG